jgi:hypothetical protein
VFAHVQLDHLYGITRTSILSVFRNFSKTFVMSRQFSTNHMTQKKN